MTLREKESSDTTLRSRIERAKDKARKWFLTVKMTTQDGNIYWMGPWITGEIIYALTCGDMTEEIEDVISSAVEYLLNQQIKGKSKYSGSWDKLTWDTAIVVKGLLRARTTIRLEDDLRKKIDSALERASLFLVKAANEDVIGRSILLFGPCYPAQTLVALKELGGYRGIEEKLIENLKQLQLPDGSWGENHFETGQILYALQVLGFGADEKWTVHNKDESGDYTYEGGIQRAIEWVERTHSPDWSWGGVTWPTTWILRAYPNYAKKENLLSHFVPALFWILDGQFENGSWFHEIDRTPFVVVTLDSILMNSKLNEIMSFSYGRLVKEIGDKGRYKKLAPPPREEKKETADTSRNRIREYKMIIIAYQVLCVSLLILLFVSLNLWASQAYSLKFIDLIALIGVEIAFLSLFSILTIFKRFIRSRAQKKGKN